MFELRFGSEPVDDRTLVSAYVSQVEVQREKLLIELAEQMVVNALWQLREKTAGKRRREVCAGGDAAANRTPDPLRNPRHTVVFIARGR